MFYWECPCGVENAESKTKCSACGTPKGMLWTPEGFKPANQVIGSEADVTTTRSQEEFQQKVYTFVIQQIKAGNDRDAISQKLVEIGVDPNDAAAIVQSINTQLVNVAKQEEIEPASMLGAVIGGILAAVLGGIIWGLIVISTGYEIGYMAWGIGGLAGFAVLLLAKGKRGIPLQTVAVVASVLGIFIGKYLTFFHYLKEAVSKSHGVEAAASLSIVSENVIQVFLDRIDLMLSGYDILWVILAVVTAWSIPKALRIKLTA